MVDVGPGHTHRDVDEFLRERGWTWLGAGDWAYALLSPRGDAVARISPFDPVGPFTATLYEEARATRRVPVLRHHQRLVGGGDLQVMERLTEVPEAEAVDFLGRLTAPSPELKALFEVVSRVHSEARAKLPWCGPLDENPSNVMRTGDGRLVLIDPYYADGPNLYAMAHSDPETFVTLLAADERRFMTEIPLAASGPWHQQDRDALLRRLRAADEAAH
ncbi:hypothetical protein GCM10028820_18120 [Tessaracoccus terricola]